MDLRLLLAARRSFWIASVVVVVVALVMPLLLGTGAGLEPDSPWNSRAVWQTPIWLEWQTDRELPDPQAVC